MHRNTYTRSTETVRNLLIPICSAEWSLIDSQWLQQKEEHMAVQLNARTVNAVG